MIAFKHHFDLEKDTIVARGIGTCVTLVKIQNDHNSSGSSANTNTTGEDE